MTSYTFTTLYIVIFNLILAGFCLEALRRTTTSISKALFCSLLGIFALWLLAIHLFVSQKLLFSETTNSLVFLTFIVLGVIIVGAMMFMTPLRKRIVEVKQEYVMLIQGLRVYFGMGFIIQAALGIMPTTFGIIDGFFHITSAFLAMKAGILLSTQAHKTTNLWTANLFGLIDILIVAGGLSFLLLDQVGPHHNVMYAALFAAPIFINLHILSLYKLIVRHT